MRQGLMALVAAMAIGGCEKEAVAGRAETPAPVTYFQDWGVIDRLRMLYAPSIHGGSVKDDLELALGDVDGDGDVDIVVGSMGTGLRVYENRIPQLGR